jgi:hypothetical protein
METVDRAVSSRRRNGSRIRVRHGNESLRGQRKIEYRFRSSESASDLI